MERQRKSSIGSMLITAVVILASIVYLIISLNTRDFLWFVSTYRAQASAIIIHCYGTDVIVDPADQAFSAINTAVNQAISQKKRWDSLSLSDETYADYLENPKMAVLEVHYEKPETIHSTYMFFKKFNQLLIPLDGRHADYNTVFGRLGEHPEAGSFHLTDKTPLIRVLEEHNKCKIQNSQGG